MTRARFEVELEPREGAPRRVGVEALRWVSPSAVVLRSRDIPDRTAAEALKGAFVFVDPRDPPPPLTDAADRLFGARALESGTERELGRIVEIQDNGAQPLLVIERFGGGGEAALLIPCVEALVGVRDSRDGETLVEIHVIPGLLEEVSGVEDPAALEDG